jgi:hypothetical protein
MGGTIALPWKSGEWNEYTFDLAADVERLRLAGGLDNSLHKVLIGLRRSPSGSSGDASGHAPVVAYFDSLEIAPRVKGTAVLDLHRELLAQLPTRVQHLVGIEVSYYGRHINAFGSRVPIPDYQGLLPKALTSAEVVDHIHRHGGLACLNHPPRVDVDTTAAMLAEQGVFGADLMEVAHGIQGLDDRLRLWDRLAQLGRIVTGVGVSDAHTAKQGWRERPGQPVRWVTRIWAESLSEEELLAGLRLGRVFFADPAAFRGTIQLTGPSGAAMGDVLALASAQAPALAVRCEGLQPGDLVAWLCNGHLVYAGSAMGETYEAEWQSSVPVNGLQALRVQIHRPRLAGNRWGGIVACSNPLYLAPAERAPETTHWLVRLS